MAEPPSSGSLSPAILRLEGEKNEALEQEDYLRAQELNWELEKERQKAPDSGTNWISWTKQLSRLNGRLEKPYQMLEDLTKELEQPSYFLQLTQDLIHDLSIDDFEEDDFLEPSVMSLDELKALVLDELQATERSMQIPS